MKTTTMKWIDQWVGIPLCAVLSPAARLWRPRVPAQTLERPGAPFLFIKLMGMGSILLTTPTVRALRRRYPNARFHLVTFAANRAFAENLGLYDAVHALPTTGFLAFAAEVFRFLARAWRIRFQATIDFEFFSRFSALLALATGAPRRVGFRSPLAWRGWLLSDDVFFSHYRHMTLNFLAQARALGATVETAAGPAGDPLALSPLRFTPEEQARARELRGAAGVPPEAPFIVVNVNASDMCLERRWPPTYFRELLTLLREMYPAYWFVFVGAPGEAAYVAEVLAVIGDSTRVVNLAGRLSLAELAALLTESRLLLTSESGPMHFAKALEVPSVSLFGPGPPMLFKPTGPRHRTLYAAVDCSPCLNYYALTGPTCEGDNVCMKSIRPPEVAAAIASLLSHAR